jgi:hypothetical protein
MTTISSRGARSRPNIAWAAEESITKPLRNWYWSREAPA